MVLRIPRRKVLLLLSVLLLALLYGSIARAQSDPPSPPPPPQNGTIPAPPPTPAPQLAPLPAAQSAAADSSAYVGVLSVIHSDNFETGEYTVAYSLLLEDGSTIALQFDPALAATAIPPAHLMGKRVTVTGTIVTSEIVTSEIVTSGSGVSAKNVLLAQSIQLANEASAAHTEATGALRYVNLLCLFPDTGIAPRNTRDEIAAFFDTSADSIPTFFKTSSYGTLNIEFTTVTAWRTLPVASASYATPHDKAYAVATHCPNLFLDQIDFAAYDGVQFFINDMWGGIAGLGGGGSVTWNGKTEWKKTTWYVSWPLGTIQHEIGHSIGMPHTDNSDGDAYTYDGLWDIMSGGDDDFAALHKARQGWIPEQKVFTLGNESSVVVDLSLQHLAARRDRPALISIPTEEGGPIFTVEAQEIAEPPYLSDSPGKLRGVIIFATDGYNFKSSIRQIGAYTDWGGAYGSGALRTGDLYINRTHRFFVEVLQESYEGATVRVGRLESVPAAAPELQLNITPVTNLPGNAAFEIKIANSGSAAANRVHVELMGDYKYTAWNGNEYSTYFAPLPEAPTAGWTCKASHLFTACTVTRIAAGATAKALFTAIAPYKTTYNLAASAFVVTEEANLANNSAKASAAFTPAPDLAVALTIGPYTYNEEYLEVRAMVTNEGHIETGATVAITLPVGLVNHTEDYNWNGIACATTGRVTQCTIANLHPGWSHSLSLFVTERTEAPPGSYTVVARVRTTPTVGERTLANNSARAVYCTNCHMPYYLPVVVKR